MQKPLVFPSRGGLTLPNRMVKSALSEALANPLDNLPNERHYTLYNRWAEAGGPAILMTGNIMVDAAYLESPRNVVLQTDANLAAFQRWVAGVHDASRGGTKLIAQLSHPGRQCPLSVNWHPVAPTTKRLNMKGPGLSMLFRPPRALQTPEIETIIAQYVRAAELSEAAGFDGVQIHSAHGYLVSQFLSKATNDRTDEWGGSAANRRRFLLAILRGVRKVVKSPTFLVCIKLNSTDFQPDRAGAGRGGAATAAGDEKIMTRNTAPAAGGEDKSGDDSVGVIEAAQAEGLIDFVEISGGTYEDMTAMQTAPAPGAQSESSRKREAFFLEFAEKIRAIVKVPLLVTGGFRTAKAMNEAVTNGTIDMVGLGRPFCLDAAIGRKLLDGSVAVAPNAELSLGCGRRFDRDMAPGLNNVWHVRQLARLSRGEETDMKQSVYVDLLTAPGQYIVDPQKYPTTFRVLAVLWMVAVLWFVVRRIQAWNLARATGPGSLWSGP